MNQTAGPEVRKAEEEDVKHSDQRFPLIRAWLLWAPLRVAGYSGKRRDNLLKKFNLSPRRLKHPFYPIPMGSAVSVLAHLVNIPGSDFLVRLATDHVWLARTRNSFTARTKTVRDAIKRFPAATRRNLTNVQIEVTDLPRGGLLVDGKIFLPSDSEKTHLIQRYAIETTRAICAAAAVDLDFERDAPFGEVQMVPHPRGTQTDLEKRYGKIMPNSESNDHSVFSIMIDQPIVSRRFPCRPPSPPRFRGRYYWKVHPYGTFLEAAGSVLQVMLDDGFSPSAVEFAEAAGFDPRTLLRKLEPEGYTYPQFRKEVRDKKDPGRPRRPTYFRNDPRPRLW